MVAVLFVCTGNICRSPIAEGVLRERATRLGNGDHLAVDSAGLWTCFAGEPPDPQAIRVAGHHGVDIAGQRARAFVATDYVDFDLILGMGQNHVEEMRTELPAWGRAAIRAFGELVPDCPRGGIPDPYGKSDREFEHVYTLIERGCEALLAELFGR